MNIAAIVAVALSATAAVSTPVSTVSVGASVAHPVGLVQPMADQECTTSAPHSVRGTKKETRVPALSRWGSYNCYLEDDVENYNDGTAWLQWSLNHGEGHKNVASDGYYGDKTRVAVLKVQYKYTLALDGVYGPGTGGRMQWATPDARAVSKWK